MTTRSLRLAVAGATAAVALLVPTAIAAAQDAEPTPTGTTARIDVAKRRCVAGIDARLKRIKVLERAAQTSRPLTDAHEATIDGFLAAARDGLKALKPQVKAATDRTALEQLCRTVVTDYRIYALRTPQVRLAIGFDTADARATQLTRHESRLQAAIDRAKANGKNTAAAEAKLAEMHAAIAAARTATAGQADALLALTPSDYNANHDVVKPYRTTLGTAHTQLKAATSAGRAVAQILKAL